MQPIDIERVTGKPQWDGFPGEKFAAKVICIREEVREESDRIFANLLEKPGVNPNMVVNCFIAMTVIAFLGTAVWMTVR